MPFRTGAGWPFRRERPPLFMRGDRGHRRAIAIVYAVLGAMLGSQCGGSSPQALPGTGGILGFVAEDGMPVPGVSITLERGGQRIASAVTNANGRYQFENLDPGPHTVSISSVGQATCPDEKMIVVVGDPGEPAPTFVRVDFPCITVALLPEIRGVIHGRVVVGSEPRSGVVVRIPGYLFTTTDANGIFRFIDVLAGDYTLTVELPEYVCPTRSVRVFTRFITDARDLLCGPG